MIQLEVPLKPTSKLLGNEFQEARYAIFAKLGNIDRYVDIFFKWWN